MPSGTMPPNVGAKLLIICELAKFLRCFLHFRLPTRLCNTICGCNETVRRTAPMFTHQDDCQTAK